MSLLRIVPNIYTHVSVLGKGNITRVSELDVSGHPVTQIKIVE